MGGRVFGCWDHPQEAGDTTFGSPVARDGRLTLVGWALSSNAHELPEIAISVDGALAVTTAPTCYREDIDVIFRHAYPSASGLTGWAATLDIAAVGAGRHVVAVALRGGSRPVSLGARTLTFTPPAEPPEASLRRVEPLLRSRDYQAHAHQIYFSSTPGDWRAHATSVFGFSPQAQAMIREPGLTLVVGAGIAPTIDNVVQLDIFDYPNVDVISEAPELPFHDGVFDALVCENVIEHVPDPFRLVSEIERVLKPGGRLGLNGTNLHFTHGFPSHFFNATEFGMQYMLQDRAHFEGSYHFNGIAESLRTVLQYYLNALVPAARAELEAMPLGRIYAALGPGAEGAERTLALMGQVSDTARRALSTNIYFIGRKRG
jgi:SAM-dependent methyltransferase